MASLVRIPVLAWHGMNVEGNGYSDNDHVAFREDLETIQRLGLQIVPLRTIAHALRAGSIEGLAGSVGLSFDDGSDFDRHDLPHPSWGVQRGMANILADFRARHGAAAQPHLNATCFAIVSPEARRKLDTSCMVGCGWWNDDWWPEAQATGLMDIGNHSWDHNHSMLDATVGGPAGSFQVTSLEQARTEIAQASRYLQQRLGRDGGVLFAYPYGDVTEFLAEEYLPKHQHEHSVLAAFTTTPAPITASTSVWRIPRFVFGLHWKRPGELEALLNEHASRPRGASFLSRRLRRTDPGPAPAAPAQPSWRDCLRTWEVHDARVVASDLFRRSFGHEVPDYPRHFVTVYSPPAGETDAAPRVVSYVHQTPFENVHLGGGMCVDAAAYRQMPRWLFEQVREQGGLATIVTRDSIGMLGDSPASFGHVGEPRSRAANLRTGYVDTGHQHLMVFWRRELPASERERLVDRVASLGPF